MDPAIIEKISLKTGIPGIIERLVEGLSGSELNSLLLEVFSRRTDQLSAPLLLNQYEKNRLVQPARVDMISLLARELQTLEYFAKRQFIPIELSPLTQLGACSVVAAVDQKKIVSASRNTELLSDATNALALYIAAIKKNRKWDEGASGTMLHYCTTHRHLRTQTPPEKGMTAHFKIGCLVSSGKDTGNYAFEKNALAVQMSCLQGTMSQVFGIKKIAFKLQERMGYKQPALLLEQVHEFLKERLAPVEVSLSPNSRPNNYYKGIQFKMVIEWNGREIEIADGGFVDWTQQMLENKKERLLISGVGIEWLHKIQQDL